MSLKYLADRLQRVIPPAVVRSLKLTMALGLDLVTPVKDLGVVPLVPFLMAQKPLPMTLPIGQVLHLTIPTMTTLLAGIQAQLKMTRIGEDLRHCYTVSD